MTDSNSDTLDDYIGTKYGKYSQACVTFVNLIFFLAVLAAQFTALTAFLKVFTEIESTWTYYIAILVVIFYTSLAGFKGVLYTDKWQFYILSMSAIIIFSLLTMNSDWQNISSLDANYFDWGFSFFSSIVISTYRYVAEDILSKRG
jgi:Na+/proline symporter